MTRRDRLRRSGLTLVEACIAVATMSIVTVLATRLVSISDRAMRKDAARTQQVIERLRLESCLRDDIQLSAEARVVSPGRLTLSFPSGPSVTYLSEDAATTRTGGRGAAQPFPGVRCRFAEGGHGLVTAKLSDKTGQSGELTLMPRNAIREVSVGAPPYGEPGSD